MEINCSKFIQELANRTIINYKYVKENFQQEKLFEVTQLINSMYCLLVVPEEIFGIRRQQDPSSVNAMKTEYSTREKNLKKYDEYREIKALLEELKDQNRIYYRNEGTYEKEYPVCSLLYNLRNSLCHDGIGFLPFQTDYKGKITNKIDDIIFEAKSLNDDRVSFLAVLSVEQLEHLLISVSGMYCHVEEGKRNSDEKKYKKFYTKLMKDVKKYLPDF